MDRSNGWLLSGAWDATVKLWPLKPGGLLNIKPTAEFYDHENSVQSVALDASASFAAAGSDDGTVMIWHLSSQTLAANCTISASRYPFSPVPVRWMISLLAPLANSILYCCC